MALAIEAFASVTQSSAGPESLRLVIAGGYDADLHDNVSTLVRLQSLCERLGLSYHTLGAGESPSSTSEADVLFLLNFSNAQRTYLLTAPNTLALLYTPTNEHFGIVPLEAGACGLPVLATNTGGPLETVLEGETGYLRRPVVEEWSDALLNLVTMSERDRKKMGSTARERVHERFSLKTLGREMDQSCREALAMGDLHNQMGDTMISGSLVLMAGSGLVLAYTVWSSGGL